MNVQEVSEEEDFEVLVGLHIRYRCITYSCSSNTCTSFLDVLRMFVQDDMPAVTASEAVQKPEDSSQMKFEVEAEMEEKRIESSESELSSDEDTKDMLASRR